MLTRDDIIDWLQTLPKNADVAIDDGGLNLVQVHGEANLEVGGMPEDDAIEDLDHEFYVFVGGGLTPADPDQIY